MPDDAMEIWKREVAAEEARGAMPASHPPPGLQPTPPRRLRMTAGDRLALRFLLPGAIGFGYALLMLFAADLDDLAGPPMALPLVLGAAAAAASSRKPLEWLGWAVVAWFTAFATVVVVAPVLIFMDFLDCWLSWLSDC